MELENQVDILAQYLRNDELHEAKNKQDSNLRKILTGLAYEFLRERDLIDKVQKEFDPNNTTDFINEWEKSVGIPDGCLTKSGSLEERRKNILLKLVGSNVSTKEQFEKIAEILGFTITVEAGGDSSHCVFPMTFPIIFTDSTLPFWIIININLTYSQDTFTFTFPITFTENKYLILECFLEKLKPSNTRLIFNYIEAV